MDKSSYIEYLMMFGLTRQEANIYVCILETGKLTGYEVSKNTGISRSNAYGSLASLVEKGGAYISEENAKKYIPVPMDEFCDNYIRRLKQNKEYLLENFPKKRVEEEGYITVDGDLNIRNKIKNLLFDVEERVYISCQYQTLLEFSEELEVLAKEEKKIVVVTDEVYDHKKIKVYSTETKANQINVIFDSRYVLTGEYGNGSKNTCLYSGQTNFVDVFKTAMSNEIKILKLQEGRNTQ